MSACVLAQNDEKQWPDRRLSLADQGSYSRKQIIRAIEQQSYDVHCRCDTTYSQNASQALIVSQVRYDVGASSLTVLGLHFDLKTATRDAPKLVILT